MHAALIVPDDGRGHDMLAHGGCNIALEDAPTACLVPLYKCPPYLATSTPTRVIRIKVFIPLG